MPLPVYGNACNKSYILSYILGINVQQWLSHWLMVGARCSSVVRVFAHGAMGRRIDPPLSYFSFQPVLHDYKGCGMCYPVYGMVHIKEPLLLIVKSSLCGGSGFLSHYQNGP